MSTVPHIVWFADVDADSVYFGGHVKQKAKLTQAKFPLIPGFVVTTHAYHDFLKENALDEKIRQLLSIASFDLADSLMQTEFYIKELFNHAKLSDEFIEDLLTYYLQIGPDVLVELHELGTHERKHQTAKITAEDRLTREVLSLWSEMFSAKALWHRHHINHNPFESSCEITIQKKIHGDKKGLVFTIDPTAHAKEKIFILTQKPHLGDKYILSKKNLTIIDRTLNLKSHGAKLTLDEIVKIATIAKQLDEHLYMPQEISWTMNGDKLYITEIKPFSEEKQDKQEAKRKIPIARGKGLTTSVGSGVVTIINAYVKTPVVNSHSVVVTHEVNHQQLKKLKKIKGLVLENHPHAAMRILLKQHGIPVVCNVKEATKRLPNGHVITVHGGNGEIYRGGFLN